MLPTGTYAAGDAEICGVTRPANTVGGDFYDVLPLIDDPEGRVIVTIGDVAGKGSPAALLMALLLAVLRTLVDEKLEARALVARLNTQICRHSPGSRFITLFYGVYTPSTGALTYVNAGQNPPLLRRADGSIERLGGTGIALGMFEGSTYRGGRHDRRRPAICSCSTATASPRPRTRPGSRSRKPGWSASSRRVAARRRRRSRPAILQAVEAHARDSRFTDDLTVLILKRAAAAPGAAASQALVGAVFVPPFAPVAPTPVPVSNERPRWASARSWPGRACRCGR